MVNNADLLGQPGCHQNYLDSQDHISVVLEYRDELQWLCNTRHWYISKYHSSLTHDEISRSRMEKKTRKETFSLDNSKSKVMLGVFSDHKGLIPEGQTVNK